MIIHFKNGTALDFEGKLCDVIETIGNILKAGYREYLIGFKKNNRTIVINIAEILYMEENDDKRAKEYAKKTQEEK